VLRNKYHITYVTVLVTTLLGTLYHIITKSPNVITKTVVKSVDKIQVVDKIVTKDKIVYVDRVVVTNKPDGTTVTEYSKEHSILNTNSDLHIITDLQAKVYEQTTESYLSNYSIDVMFNVPKDNWKDFKPSWQNTEIVVGQRVFSSPLFVTIGTDTKLTKVLVGIRLEF